MKSTFAVVSAASLAFAAALAACGSSSNDNPGTPVGTTTEDAGPLPEAGGGDDGAVEASAPVDAGPDVVNRAGDGGDNGAPSTTYPAFPVDTAQVVTHQFGQTLAAPVVVTITWDDDPLQSTWEDFGDKIGASTYWSTTTSEYGVGPAVSGPQYHVRLAGPAPSVMSPSDVITMANNELTKALAAANSDAGSPADAGADASSDAGAPATWPAPTAQTIYAFYLSPTTSFQEQGQDLCQFLGGYHDEIDVNGNPYSYSVVPRCSPRAQDEEFAAAHELIEAATDPDTQNSPAYIGFDADHFAWDVQNDFQSEVGDACENFNDAYYQDTETSFPYWVQRTWSNASAKAGHDPCVPAPAGPYFGATMLAGEYQDITVTVPELSPEPTVRHPKGFAAALGQPIVFQVGFFSDADTGGPITLSGTFPKNLPFQDANGNPLSNGTGSISIDKTSGVNGEKAYVTVTATTAGKHGFEFVEVVATVGSKKHAMPILIQNL